jgi:hypothetical protein
MLRLLRQPGGFEGLVSGPTVVPLDEAALLHPYGSRESTRASVHHMRTTLSPLNQGVPRGREGSIRSD